MPPPEGRSPIAVGFEAASRISVVGMTFVIPILVGVWLDRSRGSAPFGLIGGVVLGLVVGLVQLIQLARGFNQPRR